MKPKACPVPVAALDGVKAYSTGTISCPTDLRLDGNEGRVPSAQLIQALTRAGVESLRRYPDRRPLETRLAQDLGLDPRGVLVTAGADDSLDRICRAYLGPTRNLVVAVPTFEMIPRYARLAGAEVRTVPWNDDGFPVAAVLEQADAETGIIAVVSPNNPTGAAATSSDLRRLAQGMPSALLLVDLAYGEFADEDLMPAVLELPSAVGVRSFSKAWGLAGTRVGYVAGPVSLIDPLRVTGGPYSVSGPSLLMAEAALSDQPAVTEFVECVRQERTRLWEELTALGSRPLPSQGNFVYVRFANPLWVRDALAGLGIAVRYFDQGPSQGWLRITCPGREGVFRRLLQSLRTVLAPQALLLDMDGVLADVSGSYRRCILETARYFGANLTADEVAAAKREPGSNNDWVLTRDLLARSGISVDLKEVTARFEILYQELAAVETLIPSPAFLQRLASRLPLAVVTGRPRQDAQKFLNRFGLGPLFSAVICMEDGPGKPDPTTVKLALDQLGVSRAWLVGDTVNDIGAARAAGVVPLGVVPPGESPTDYPPILTAAGAGRILSDLEDLEEVLP